VYKNKALLPGEEILPDEMLVSVVVTSAKKAYFKYHQHVNSLPEVRSHLAMEAGKPYTNQLSSFSLLLQVARQIGMPLVGKVCTAIRDKTQLSQSESTELRNALNAKQLI
jgi:hypothetical protein